MAQSFLVRISSGEVLGVSTDAQAYAGVNAGLTVITDPSAPDGFALVPPKIWTGSVLRNATAPEQAAFVTGQASDLNLSQRAIAKAYLNSDPVLKKLFGAMVDVLVVQFNLLRQNPTQVFAAGTKAQFIAAVLAAIDAGGSD